MKITLKRTTDGLSPSLAAKLRVCKNPVKAHRAIGLALVSLAQRAFTQSSLRPAVWPALKPATIRAKQRAGYGTKPLISSGNLAQSPRVISASANAVEVGGHVQVGSYSLDAIHQLGAPDAHIPARPTWPFDAHGKPTDRGKRSIISAARATLKLEQK